jgi:hypothetical protein
MYAKLIYLTRRALLLLCAVGLLLGTSLIMPLAQPDEAAAATAQISTEYRTWLEDAKKRYPYRESLQKMTNVMMCESGGDRRAYNPHGPYYGLFQYSMSTWKGTWNAHKDKSIYDARAQIYATARAWYQGKGPHWWPQCYSRTR